MLEKVILAFSGGLDTAFSLVWLREHGHKVITVYVDTFGLSVNRCKKIEEYAYQLGAFKHYTINAVDDYVDNIVVYLIKCHGLYQNIYPQLCSDRYIIVSKCVEVAEREGTNIISHGCTSMGNDQVRFDLSIKAHGDYKILAPIREIQKEIKGKVRLYELDYLRSRGFNVPVKHKKYSINQNILGVTVSGSEIDEYKEPFEDIFVLTKQSGVKLPIYVSLYFENGIPVAIDGKKKKVSFILKKLNNIVGAYGIGRYIYTGDCIIGIKGHIVFECPGIHTLLIAHQSLEESILTFHQNQFKNIIGQKWAYLVYSGLYYEPLRQDLEAIIDSMQKKVTGEVKLKLSNGIVLPVSCNSKYILQDKDSIYAQSASWDPIEAEGFIKLFGMSTVLSNKRS